MIFLHVFRDSPFNYIDENRIFVDYVDWVIETLRIISSSNERWIIKKHPAAGRWGENQDKWLTSIIRHVFGAAGLPRHISIMGDGGENISLISKAKRIVTYSGTVHLEAASFGIRPIVICDVTMTGVEPAGLAKPRTLEEYASMLNNQINLEASDLTEETMHTARTLLHCLERELTLKNEIAAFDVYRGDSRSVLEQLFDSTLQGVSQCLPNLVSQGESLGRGFTRTFSPELFERVEKSLSNQSNTKQ